MAQHRRGGVLGYLGVGIYFDFWYLYHWIIVHILHGVDTAGGKFYDMKDIAYSWALAE